MQGVQGNQLSFFKKQENRKGKNRAVKALSFLQKAYRTCGDERKVVLLYLEIYSK